MAKKPTTKKTAVKKPSKKELVKAPEQTAADLFSLKDNLDGVEPRLPQITILHSAQMFSMPDDTKVDQFSGRILDLSRANAYWSTAMEENAGTPPDCFSVDGITPDMNTNDVQNEQCYDCQFNQFGTDPKGGKGKACKNMKRVHIVLPGNLMPYRLTLPPSSLAACDLYVSLLTSTGQPFQLLDTMFELKAGTSKGGIEFSEIVMIGNIESAVTDLTKAKEIRKLRDDWIKVMREQVLIPDEVS